MGWEAGYAGLYSAAVSGAVFAVVGDCGCSTGALVRLAGQAFAGRSGTSGYTAAEDGVLDYAPAPYIPPLLGRWPVLLAPAAIPDRQRSRLLPWRRCHGSSLHGNRCMSGSPGRSLSADHCRRGVYLLGSVVLCAKGLRRTARGRTAAAEWELLPMLKVIGASAAVLLFVAGVVTGRRGRR